LHLLIAAAKPPHPAFGHPLPEGAAISKEFALLLTTYSSPQRGEVGRGEDFRRFCEEPTEFPLPKGRMRALLRSEQYLTETTRILKILKRKEYKSGGGRS